jgi:hypothetical protein
MSGYTFHLINNNREFLHSDSIDSSKNYNLYVAIKNLKEYALANTGFDLENPIYLGLKSELESAMIAEVDVMDSFPLILDARVFTQILNTIDPQEARYLNLNRLFQFLVNTKYVTEYASRVNLVKSVMLSNDVLVIDSLVDDKSDEYVFVDSEYGYEIELNTLEILNLQAKDKVDSTYLTAYVLALDSTVPLENLLKHNLFNYQTFSNSELVFNTLLNNVPDLEVKATKLKPLIDCSYYFWFTKDNSYQTFTNYIDFKYLETVMNYCIDSFKYYLDLIDSARITTGKDPLSFYPSGQNELFEVLSAMRRILAILAIVYNLAKMFQSQYYIKTELESYLNSLTDLSGKQLTESSTISKMSERFPDLSDSEIRDILFNKGGNEEHINYSQTLFSDSYYAYANTEENLKGISDYFTIMQDTSSSYNSVVSDGTESGLALDDISQKLIENMEYILDRISEIRDLLNLIKFNTLPSFTFLFDINMIIDLSFLNGLSQLITSFNNLLYNFNCMLNAIACFASYVKDMYDTLKTFFNNEDKFDITNYLMAGFTADFNGSAKTVTTDMLFNNESSILSILSELVPTDELGKIADALKYSISSLNVDCLSSWTESLYSDALTSMKDSIKAGQRCKITPGGRLSVDARLRFNLGLDIPDLRFQFRSCTGAS